MEIQLKGSVGKKSNLTKSRTPNGGWAEWRSAKGAPATFRHTRPKGESGFARVSRLQRDTPRCACGAESVVSRTRSGVTKYLCTDCLNGTHRAQSGSRIALVGHIRKMPRDAHSE